MLSLILFAIFIAVLSGLTALLAGGAVESIRYLSRERNRIHFAHRLNKNGLLKTIGTILRSTA